MWSILFACGLMAFVSGFGVAFTVIHQTSSPFQRDLYWKYISSVLHNIRISTSTMQLATETLQWSPELEDDTLRVLEYMDTAVKVLRTTTDNLAYFNTIVFQKALIPKIVPVDIVTLVKELKLMFNSHPINSVVPIKFIVNRLKHRFCLSDPRFIKHIASNLILNSKEHTETGLVQFRWSIEDTMMKIEVMDTGCGIQSLILNQMFKSPIISKDKIGMSLFACKAMVDSMNGKIGYESLQPSGSRFWFRLPYIPMDNTPNHEPFELQTFTVSRSINYDMDQISEEKNDDTLSVLIVEDDGTNRELMAMTLKVIDPKITIQEASQGEEAVKMCNEFYFDIVFMDLVMPVKDGYQAAKEILHKRPDTDIVAVTGSDVHSVEKRCREIGFNMIISKPLNRGTLRKAISTIK